MSYERPEKGTTMKIKKYSSTYGKLLPVLILYVLLVSIAISLYLGGCI